MSGPSHLCLGCRGKFGPPGASGRCCACSLLGRFTDLLYSDRFPSALVDSAEDICRGAYHQALEACDGHLARLEHLAATREAPPEKREKGDKTDPSPRNRVKDEILEHSSTAAKTKPTKPEDRSSHFAEPVEPEASSPRPPPRESPSPESKKKRKRHHSKRKDKRREEEERSHHPGLSEERERPAEGRRIERKRRRSPTPEEFEEVPLEEEDSEESSGRARSSGRGLAPGTRDRRSPPGRSKGSGRRPAEPARIGSLGIGEAIYLRGHRVESIGARTKEKQSVKGSNSTADTERVLVTGVGLDAA